MSNEIKVDPRDKEKFGMDYLRGSDSGDTKKDNVAKDQDPRCKEIFWEMSNGITW